MAKQEGIGSHFETLTVHKLYLWPVRQDWQGSWNRAAIYMIILGGIKQLRTSFFPVDPQTSWLICKKASLSPPGGI